MSEQTIYLMAGRKTWHHEVPIGWREVAWERFDYVECGVYSKPVADLTEEDKRLVASYGEVPEGWIDPSPRYESVATPDFVMIKWALDDAAYKAPETWDLVFWAHLGRLEREWVLNVSREAIEALAEESP